MQKDQFESVLVLRFLQAHTIDLEKEFFTSSKTSLLVLLCYL